MITNTVTVTTAQHLTNAAIDAGEKNSVISAVMKYKTTEMARHTLGNAWILWAVQVFASEIRTLFLTFIGRINRYNC